MAFQKILFDFPEVISAFAYGSAVFTQESNSDMKNNMLDVVFIVDNALRWHKSNLQMNRSHYSMFARSIGPSFIASLQENLGAKMYYNTLVPWNGQMIKYGVITQTRLKEDLLHWQSLYSSGRLQKPVKFLSSISDQIQSCLDTNLKHALNASLLCLPEKFSVEDLFMQITRLSYDGDFRMIIGENKNKVSNIVKPNIELFRKLYYSHLINDKFIHIDKDIIIQDLNPETRFARLRQLPCNVKSRIVNWQMSWLSFQTFNNPSNEMQDAILYSLAHNQIKTQESVQKATRSIVRYSSITQSSKGILTTGISKSLIYSGKKLAKMLRGIFR